MGCGGSCGTATTGSTAMGWGRQGFKVANDDTFMVKEPGPFAGWKDGYGPAAQSDGEGIGRCSCDRKGRTRTGDGRQPRIDSGASSFVKPTDLTPHHMPFAPASYMGGGNEPGLLEGPMTVGGAGGAGPLQGGPCPPAPWFHPCCTCSCPPGGGTSFGIAASAGNPTSPPPGGWDWDLSRQLCESTPGCKWSEREECTKPDDKKADCIVLLVCHTASHLSGYREATRKVFRIAGWVALLAKSGSLGMGTKTAFLAEERFLPWLHCWLDVLRCDGSEETYELMRADQPGALDPRTGKDASERLGPPGTPVEFRGVRRNGTMPVGVRVARAYVNGDKQTRTLNEEQKKAAELAIYDHQVIECKKDEEDPCKKIAEQAPNFPGNDERRYDAIRGPNSNTFVRWLIGAAGLKLRLPRQAWTGVGD